MIALVLAALVSVPAIEVVDEHGRVRSTNEWRGTPVILAPLYTRCPLACPMIVKGLKTGLAESDASAASYRVVLLSFDPRDTPEHLRRFRERNRVPLAWTLATARDARPLLDALGYRYAVADRMYTHPNAIVFLTPELQPAKSLYGTTYEGRAIDEALAIARGRADWVARFGPWLLAALLLVAALSLIQMLSPRAARDV
jgi:protein SCO1/2